MSTQYKNSKSNSNKICPLKSVGAIVTFDNIWNCDGTELDIFFLNI